MFFMCLDGGLARNSHEDSMIFLLLFLFVVVFFSFHYE